MPLKTHQLESPSLNLTPMIDVVFQLIIFFMVGTRFAELERQVAISVPQVQHAQPTQPAQSRKIVTVFADGTLMLADQRLTHAELTDTLRIARQHDPALQVIVRTDASGIVQSLADVLSSISEAGIFDIGFAVKPHP